jgi:ABC-type sugar transport system ATPase subunit
MSEIHVKQLTKTYGRITAVDNLDFTFPQGKVTCLLGPSGCGKTTLLRMIAGLETPTSGRVFIGGTDVTRLPPRKRNIGMVFQYPVVYRGISVYENIELPLKRRKVAPAERKRRIEEVLELLDLTVHADKDSTQLDNISRQKVSVARAIAYQPDIIIFDEPMTNIDANSKVQFSHFFKTLSQQLNQVIVYVTHDQTEAMTLADRIALMKDGRMIQCDDPRTLYNEPQEVFAGWFLGNPGMNFFSARADDSGSGAVVTSDCLPSSLSIASAPMKGDVTIGIRPEHIRLFESGTSDTIQAKVKRASMTIGGQYLVTLDAGGTELKAKTMNLSRRFNKNDPVWIAFPKDKLLLFDQNKQRNRAVIS